MTAPRASDCTKTKTSRRRRRWKANAKAFRRRAAAWRRRARRAAFAAMLTAGMAGASVVAQAQIGAMGQGAMAPMSGIANRAVTGLKNLNQNGPGWLYWGVNPADRGLGYNGSYMTLGGFIPYAEDDLGGFWAADLRGHLSEYGGFFSNVGAVRKQFIGGTLLGIGVYWDYDGDQNQYPTGGAPGTEEFGQFGHSYNQVGISAEWLTDYGNLRSNGYIPVGRTAHTVGNPGVPYFQNFIMCQYGLDAALTGADLEVGAYVPGLSDWAGMISVGGYALGNSRYDWTSGSLSGQDVVPWFGGVYTRLDMTFLENWDFSIQYNNDSFFDSTGFVRLTYRMGGSRRRNVPDQVEQPMMRNEHIVRAHQTPEVAGNPYDGGNEWYVIHVNNTAPDGGDGTYENPFNTLAAANTAAAFNWDIVLVNPGDGTAAGYDTPFTPAAGAFNQFLIGDGRSFSIDTTCGPVNLATLTNGTAPLLSNPGGTSINVQEGLVVNNFTIRNSAVAIGTVPGADLTGLARSGESPFGPSTQADWAAGRTMVSNVVMDGQGNASRRGVFLENTTGGINFSNTTIQGMSNGSFVVDGGDPTVNFQGRIENASSTSRAVNIQNTTGGTISLAVGGTPVGATVANSIVDNGGLGVLVANNTGGTVNLGNTRLENNPTALAVFNSNATVNLTDSRIKHSNTSGAAIAVSSGSPNVTIGSSNTIENTGGRLLLVDNTTGGTVTLAGATQGSITDTGGTGVLVNNASGNVILTNATIASSGNGITVQDSDGDQMFTNVIVTGTAGTAGVALVGNDGGRTTLTNVDITTTNAIGLSATGNSADPYELFVGGGSSIASTNRAALVVDGIGNLDAAFDSVASTNSTQHGISIMNSAPLVGPTGGVFVGTTNVTGAAANGINLVNNVPVGPDKGVLFTSSATTIANTTGGLSGIFVQNTNASFTNATVTGWTNSVTATSPGAADETIVLVRQSSLTGSSGPAVNLQAGQGSVNATFLDNTISSATAAGPSVQAIVGNTASSVLNLDLSGNLIGAATAPANAVVLANSVAGTLGVTQTAAPPATIEEVISSANGSPGSVIVTKSGTITEGVTVAIP